MHTKKTSAGVFRDAHAWRIILLLLPFLLCSSRAYAQWPNGYLYRGVITVAHGQVPNTDQTNFPVLISGTYPDLASTTNGGKVVNGSGYDVIFTSDLLGFNKLNFERESYSPATGNVLFWVQAPVLSHTIDTLIYVFYGNPSINTDQSNPAGVWDSNYLGVWHLDGSPAGPAPQELDSTAGQNNLTAVGSWAPVNSAPGQIGNSVYSNFNQGFTSSSPALTPATTMTVSAWINTTVGGGVPTIMSQYDFSGESAGYYLIVNASSGHLRYKLSAGNNGGTPQTTFDALTGTINDGVWHYVAATYTSGSNPSLYVDGNPVAAPPTNGGINGIFQGSLANSTPFLLADFYSYYYQGYVDEARLSRIARSADWVAAEYHNQYSAATFYSMSWGQTASPSSPWLVALPESLSFAGAAGSPNPQPQQVTISTNASAGTLNWMATANQPWIQFSTAQSGPFTPTLSGVGAQTIWMQAAIGAMTAGSYPGLASIAAAGAVGSPQSISVSLSLSQPLPSLSWPNGYYYSGTITVSHLQVPNTDQTNFPVLVSGGYPALATATNGGQVINANGYDIIFTSDAAGTKPLNFERQSYSPATGQVAFWVQLPTLSHATDTTFYMFYCNPSVATDPSNKTAVWDANYAGVWHMDDNAASPTVSDSSGQGNNGTAMVNTSSKTTSGIVGSALSFNGGSDQVTTSVVSGRTFTWEAWVNSPVMTSGKYQSVLTLTAGSYMLMDVQLGADSMWSTDGLNGALLGTTALANNTWYHLAFVRSGDSSANGYTAYVNGVQKGQAVSGAWGGAGNLTMGARPGTTGQNLGGSIDEVRVSNTVRSADWIATEFNNQSSPATFYLANFGLTYGTITPPALSVSAGTLTYVGTAGSPLAAQMVTVSSSNSTPLGSWTAIVNPSFPWITISTTVNGTYTNTASGLGTSTIYVQVATGSLPAGGATTSGSFTIAAGGANPSMVTVNVAVTVNSSTGTTGNTYGYTGTITVSHLQVPNTDQTNFPVLVSGTYPALANISNGGQVTNANGYDIVFTSDSAGTIPLNFERQSYSPATGQVAFWVQLPTLSHSSDTTFYVFYGNPSVTTDQSNKTAVWDSNYSGVWHMDDDAANATVSDSSSHGNNGTAAANTSGKIVSGVVGNALSFNGSTDQVATSVVSGKTFTWEAWVNSSEITSTVYQSILTLAGSSYMLMDVESGADSLWSPEGLNGSVLGITGLANNTWYHMAFVRSGDSSASGYTAYLNGVPKGQTSSGGWSSAANLTMGARIGVAGQNLAGLLDEVRVSNTVRSADWIATEYHNQSSPGTFYATVFGLTNAGGTGAPPALSVSAGMLTYAGTAGSPNPVAQSVNVTSSNSTTLGSWTATVNPSFPWITLSASLNGSYTNTASGSGASTIYVQVAIGSLTAGGVTTNGSFTITASGASPSMATVNVAVTVNSPSGATGNTYQYAATITVSHLQVPNTDQINFPVLVSGTYPALATTANGGQVTNANGYDIIFTSDSAGTIPLNFERQNYSPATGQVAFWVQLPMLSHTDDTTFYMFYGNASITMDQSSKTAVWDSNYAGVWHMDDAANATVSDSSSHGNNGTAAANTSAKTTSGVVGNALSFNGSTDQVTTSVVSGKTFTWEAWVNSPEITSTVYQSILTLAGSSYMLMDVELGADSLWSPEGLNGSVLGITGLTNNTWYHLVFVRSGDSSASGYTAYLNGVPRGQMSSGGWSNTANLTMGARIGVAGQNLAGMLDEVRVSNTVRSADWIATEYHNQSSPSTFYSAVFGLPNPGGASVPAFRVAPREQYFAGETIKRPTSRANLSVAPTYLLFNAVAGLADPTAQSVSLFGSGKGSPGSWTATASATWITVSPASGSGAQAIFVGAVSNGLGAGTYTGTVTISDPNAYPTSQEVNVSLVVIPPPAPPTGGGETLYNGIVLPQQWPPVGEPTQAYQIPSYLTNPPAVVPIDVGRQLFVDDFLISSTSMARTQHQPVMYSGNPILAPNNPLFADDAHLVMPFGDGVWVDPKDGLFKMWMYCGYGNEVCYATSTDGIHWVRPTLAGAPENLADQVLAIGGGRDSDVIWMDLQDPNPQQKYKAFAYYPQGASPPLMLVWFSPDGIVWTYQPQFTILSLQDRTTLFWNPFRNVWVDSMRQQLTLPALGNNPAYSSARVRYYAESPNLSTWTPADFGDSYWTGLDLQDQPYTPGGALPQLYNLDAVAYESVLVGLFSWFNPGPASGSGSDPNGGAGPDLVEIGVGFSRDGFNWVRPNRGGGPNNAFIPASNILGTWNAGNTQSAGGGFLVVGDQLYFYFSGRNGGHCCATAGSTGLATLRRDGFYSMDAGTTQATLTTRPVKFSGKYLFVNVKDPQGSLQVQILVNGQVMATSAPLSVDSTLQQVTWNGLADLSAYAGQNVQFQFNLTNGELYSFWVTPDSNGASNGYVAAGGPGFTSNVDDIGSASLSAAAK